MFRKSLLVAAMLAAVMGADCGGGAIDGLTTADANEADTGDVAGSGAGERDGAGETDENEALFTAMGGHILTEIRNSSNIDPLGGPAFIQFFRADLELCSSGRFEYVEVDETTISFVEERREFSAAGTWRVRVEASGETILSLDFQEVSEGEPFENEVSVVFNPAGESFLNGVRVFVTEGDNVCD